MSAINQAKDADLAWAEHLIWMEGGEAPEPRPRNQLWIGIALALATAVVAWATREAASHHFAETARWLDPVLIAMMLGLFWGWIDRAGRFLSGMNAAVRWFLPTGIVLLGARLDVFAVAKLGALGVAASLVVIGFAVGLSLCLGRLWRVDRKLALLLGFGTGICGGTAIVAMAPLLKASRSAILLCVAVVTLVGFVLMLALPLIGSLFGWEPALLGWVAGLGIQQTPQAIAAGFAFHLESGEIATLAKLSRILWLGPLLIGLGWWLGRGERSGQKVLLRSKRWYQIMPGFVLGFALLAGLVSIGWIPEVALSFRRLDSPIQINLSAALASLSSFCLIVAMVGVGYQTRLDQIPREAGRALMLVALVSTALVVLITLIAQPLIDATR
ncbi:MAG: putative sulfate exporter family transporter [Verrucomicrobiota bacterium]